MTSRRQLSINDLLALAGKSNIFARDLLGDWKDTFPFDAKGFQLRYLYANAYRAAKSAQSFWILQARQQFHDAQIIARTLLERIVNGRVARCSPERACGILATNRFNDREGVRKMMNFSPENFDTPEMQARQDVAQHEIDKFLALAGRTEVLQWNFAEMCREVDLEWAYRMLYRDLSEFTHASYGVARPHEGDDDSNIAKYLALLAPMDTATQYDLAYNDGQRQELYDAYRQLYEEITDPLFGRRDEPRSETSPTEVSPVEAWKARQAFIPKGSPKKLYKYYHPDRIDVLQEGKIAYSPPNRYNDPFDTNPAVSIRIDDEERSCRTRQTEMNADLQSRLSQAWNQSTGAYCLSENPFDPLMLSHYADEHRGFVVEFDAEHSFFMSRVARVWYSDNRPLHRGPDDVRPIWMSKSSCWKYEKEWRSLEELKNCEQVVVPRKCGADLRIYLREFPKDAVTKITCGCRMLEEQVKHLRWNLRGWGYDCRLEKAHLAPHEYDFSFENYPLL